MTYFFDIYLPRSCPRQAITFPFGKFDGPQLFLIVMACLFGTAFLLLARAIQYFQTMFTKTLGQLMPSGFVLLDRVDPIHISSLLDQLTERLDHILKESRRLKGSWADVISERTAVISSAYCSNFVSCPFTKMPFICTFCRTAIARASAANTKR